MVTRRRQRPADDESEAIAATLKRLAAANERLQEEIEERVAAERGWHAERLLLRAMIDTVPDYLFVKDTESRFIVANKAVGDDLDNMRPEDLIGKSDFEIHPREVADKFYADDQTVIRSGQPMIDIEEFVIGPSGAKKWLSTSKLPLRDENGDTIGVVGIARDVTRRKQAEDEVHFLAHHDALTRLPNRTLLTDRLSQAILQSERNGRWVTVAFIDLDNFKLVNDGLGHGAGDTLLKTVADRMLTCVRATDTVVRLGGDEFVIVLVDQPDSASPITAILENVRATIAEPIVIDGQALHMTCSMGLATFPTDGRDAETLLKNADAAMYQAKANGRDNFQFFTETMNTEVHERLSLQLELRQAIANSEFVIHYQPQVDLRSGRICAVEALVRWRHPTLGLLPPNRFISLAEESGLIVQLGDWVLRTACRQNKAWQDAGFGPIRVCVNVSARQFKEKNWIDRVKGGLSESGLAPSYLELELTESMIMQDIEQAIATMRALQAIGVQFAIDDFGTGYSSLSALKSFPVARLKIDRSFVQDLPDNENDRGIATAVISLGQKLNMKVIAEGVETEAQIAFLTENRCDEIQGFQFSKPVESKAIEVMLRRQAGQPPAAA
jgi:diguanylate cyclase (GGDEF)-like protein/PAS domain S-box-containing protein